jgi:nucleoside-diphosphate-sugar epimerase
MMQTILGSSGVIGKELAKSLTQYTDKIRVVSRNPKKVNQTDELFAADLTNAEQTLKAIEGSEIAYLTVGIQYKASIWQQQWPVIMKNVIDACKVHNTKLVFFDNVYAYGKVNGWMTEETPYKPVSKKGEVRKQIAEMLMNEVEKGNIKAQIVRAADFYGPDTPLSMVTVTVFNNFNKGKKAQLFISDKYLHSYTYTPDAGKATAILGNTESAYNQIWHLPTNKNVMTGKQFVEAVAEAFSVEPKYMLLNNFMISLAGLFIPEVRESKEMMYQVGSNYLFDSTKFEKAFNFEPIDYKAGIKETVAWMKSN